MLRVVAGLCLLAPAAWAPDAAAGPDIFTTGGPYGGFIFSMAKVAGLSPPSDDTVFAGTRFGVFKSTDGGTTWAAANNGLPLYPVLSLAVADPSGPIVLYAGTLVGGIFKSVDGGGSWTPVNTGIPSNPIIKALAAAPSDPNTVYASVETVGVFVTTNAGGVWSATAAIPNNVTSLVVSPITAATAYAGTQGSGVYKTTTTGGAWGPANVGLAGGALFVTDLTIDAVSGTVLYAGTIIGVYRSPDSAGSWNPEPGSPVNVRKIHLEAPGDVSPWTIVAGTDQGFYLGSDSLGTGATWTQANGTAPTNLSNLGVTAMAANPIVYLGTQGSGVFLTTDGGGTWAEVNQGLGRAEISAVVVDPTTPTTLYAADKSGGGVYQSVDGGASWARVNDASLTETKVSALAIDPTGTILYAGTSFSGVFKSVDSGATWAPINTGSLAALIVPSVTALVMDPTNPLVLYAAVQDVGPVHHLHVTVNGGGIWTDLGPVQAPPPDPRVAALVIDPTAVNIIYAATDLGVFKSLTSASAGSWAPMNVGLPTTDVRALAIQPGTPSTLLAATAAGVYRSVDGAASWGPATSGLPGGLSSAVVYDPATPTVAFAAVSGSGIFGSTDSGVSWAAYNPGLAGLTGSLLVNALTTGSLHVGTDGFGVFDNTYTLQPLTVATTGTGTGSVSALPGPIACGLTCTAVQITGTSVTLTATPGPNSTFTGWTGGGCSGTGTCTVTMSGPVTVTATFTLNTFLLTVSKAGLGSGTVVDLTTAINCGATCSATFAFGTVVTLTATPAGGSFFAGWSGGGCSGTGTCSVTMTAATAVTATFALIPGAGPFTLTVSKIGSGSGTVTVTPPGFACDASCVGIGLRLAGGTPVTLSATGGGGVEFAGWSGGGCAGAAPCTLILGADATVTALFGIHGGIVTGAGAGGGPHVELFTPGGTAVTSVMAYAAGFTGGVFVAAGDLDGDGRAEIVTAAGAGGGPHVRAFSGADGSDTGISFMAYDAGLRGGARVASCDVDGDGRAEIATGAAPGGGPHVRVFRLVGTTAVELAGFFAFPAGFTGGVWVACADVDGDGRGDVIVGAGAGGAPHVRVFSLATGTPVEVAGFLALDPAFPGGVRVAASDLDGDGRADVVVGAGPGGTPLVQAFSGATLAPLLTFLPYPAGFTGGVFVGAGPGGQLVTGPGSGWNPHVRAFTAALVEVASFFAYDPSFLGGVSVAVRP